jgi:hypothetical protein
MITELVRGLDPEWAGGATEKKTVFKTTESHIENAVDDDQ